jgi:K+-transporting ATPase KdpF subunit
MVFTTFLYPRLKILCSVFIGLLIVGRSRSSSGREYREASCGYRISNGDCGVFDANARTGRRVCGAGEKEMSWAYALSGALALALLGYLVAALIRAEDL